MVYSIYLLISLLLDIGVANIMCQPILYIHQFMLFYYFGKGMIPIMWFPVIYGICGYVYDISLVPLIGHMLVSISLLQASRVYIITYPYVYRCIAGVLLVAYILCVQPDIVYTYTMYWTQMVIFANMLVATVFGYISRKVGKATA